jgi:hypothetical protein
MVFEGSLFRLEDDFVSELVRFEIIILETRSTTHPKAFSPSIIMESIKKLTRKQEYSDCHQLPPEGFLYRDSGE